MAVNFHLSMSSPFVIDLLAISGCCRESSPFRPLLLVCCPIIAHPVCWLKCGLVYVIFLCIAPRASGQTTIPRRSSDNIISSLRSNFTYSTFLNHRGCLLISMSATHSPISLSVNDLIALSVQPTSILLSVIYLVLIGTLFWVVQKPSTEKNSKTRGYGLNRLFIHDDFMNKCTISYRLAFALLAGSLSGNQIYIKCIGIIIKEYSSIIALNSL